MELQKAKLIYCRAIFIISVLGLCACEQLIQEEPNTKSPENFLELFDTFWQGMNSNYLYWDIDPTDWDQQYRNYREKFSELDLSDQNDVRTSVTYFQDMTAQLIDGHFNIEFTHPALAGTTINPLYDRKKKNRELHYFYSYRFYDTTYLDKEFALGSDNRIGNNGAPLICLSGTINNNIIFFSCNFFSLSRALQQYPDGPIASVLDHLSTLLTHRSAQTKGIIIDVRGNEGGDLSDLNFLVGQLISTRQHFGFSQYKRSPAKTDFTPWVAAYVNPVAGGNTIECPIVILADNYSASLSESCVLAIQSIPNSTFIGEITWGATGPVVDREVYQSGGFKIAGFMNVRGSSCKFKDLNGECYEGKGISPDIYIPYNADAYVQGIDLQLEKAIEILNR